MHKLSQVGHILKHLEIILLGKHIGGWTFNKNCRLHLDPKPHCQSFQIFGSLYKWLHTVHESLLSFGQEVSLFFH